MRISCKNAQDVVRTHFNIYPYYDMNNSTMIKLTCMLSIEGCRRRHRFYEGGLRDCVFKDGACAFVANRHCEQPFRTLHDLSSFKKRMSKAHFIVEVQSSC